MKTFLQTIHNETFLCPFLQHHVFKLPVAFDGFFLSWQLTRLKPREFSQNTIFTKTIKQRLRILNHMLPLCFTKWLQIHIVL